MLYTNSRQKKNGKETDKTKGETVINIFEKLFRRKKEEPKNAQAIIGGGAGFSTFGGDPYNNDVVRGCVDCIARHISKLKGEYIITSGEMKKPGTDAKLTRLLQIAPNKYENAADLLYKAASHYLLKNNAFILIERDEAGNPTGFYNIDATQATFMATQTGELYINFRFSEGEAYTFPYFDIIHIRRHFAENKLLGNDNSALFPAVELSTAQNDGIIYGIKSAANIRGVLEYTQIVAPDKLKEEKDRFVKDYLDVSNNGGVVVIDAKQKYTPINNAPATITAEQMNAAKQKIYDYFNVSEAIITSNFDENQWAAFYEAVVEPFALLLSLEYTRKIFTEREIAFGNSIMFTSGRLAYAGNATKINLINTLLPYSLITINEAREILNLPPVPDGNKRLQTLNVVDQTKANKYQVGEEQKTGKTDPTEEPTKEPTKEGAK